MGSWLRNAATAAIQASDDSRRWLPGALAALAFLGWLPFVLAVVPLPSAADLAFFGADIVTSGAGMLNAVLLLVGVAAAAALAGLLAAFGAVVVLWHEGAAGRDVATAVGRAWLVQLLAATPFVASVAALAAGIAAVAPGEYQSPNIGGPVEARIARDVLPLLILVVAALIAGQLYGAVATRRAVRSGSLGSALRWGFADLRARPLPLLGVAVVTLIAQAVVLAVTFALLRVLWAPIGLQLAAGFVSSPPTLLLLVGFVAIWLCLLVAAGVVFAWASAWWTNELEGISRA
jgi:hypothetical protein